MKSPTTIRRELKRLRGMRKRSGLTAEQSLQLMRDVAALEWVLGKGWARPSERQRPLSCRRGEP